MTNHLGQCSCRFCRRRRWQLAGRLGVLAVFVGLVAGWVFFVTHS